MGISKERNAMVTLVSTVNEQEKKLERSGFRITLHADIAEVAMDA